jgi:hypothetical protein
MLVLAIGSCAVTAASQTAVRAVPDPVVTQPPTASAGNSLLTAVDWKETFENFRNLATALGIVVGGMWAYLKFFRGRTFVPRLDLTVTGKPVRCHRANGLHLHLQVKNVGLSEVRVQKAYSRIEVSLLNSEAYQKRYDGKDFPLGNTVDLPGWTKPVPFPVLQHHAWFEPGETVTEGVFFTLPPGDHIAYRAELVLTAKQRWWQGFTLKQWPKRQWWPEREWWRKRKWKKSPPWWRITAIVDGFTPAALGGGAAGPPSQQGGSTMRDRPDVVPDRKQDRSDPDENERRRQEIEELERERQRRREEAGTKGEAAMRIWPGGVNQQADSDPDENEKKRQEMEELERERQRRREEEVTKREADMRTQPGQPDRCDQDDSDPDENERARREVEQLERERQQLREQEGMSG